MSIPAAHTRPAALACAFIITLLAGVALAGFGAERAHALETNCANADAKPADVNRAKLRRAIQCMVREVRAKRGVSKVRAHSALRRIAERHTRVMLKQDCFKHRCAGEKPLKTRLESSSYLRPGHRYGYGQNLGYFPTPRQMMEAWLARKPFRRNILGKRYTHVGVGVGKGAPERGQPDSEHATYTLLLAWRKR